MRFCGRPYTQRLKFRFFPQSLVSPPESGWGFSGLGFLRGFLQKGFLVGAKFKPAPRNMANLVYAPGFDHAHGAHMGDAQPDLTYKLFELPPDMEEELGLSDGAKGASGGNSPGGTVYLKGGAAAGVTGKRKRGGAEASGDVVLCTGKKTYSIVCAESSNMNLLVPGKLAALMAPGQENGVKQIEVAGVSQRVFTLKPTAPRTRQLEDLLQKSTFTPSRSESDEGPDNICGWTLAELESRVQASKAEILEALEIFEAVKLPSTEPVAESRWCIVDPEYFASCFDSILSCVEALGLDPTAISVEDVLGHLEDHHPRWILEQILRSRSTHDLTQTVVAIDARKTRIFRLKQHLEKGDKNGPGSSESFGNGSAMWRVDRLARAWSASLPDAFKPPVEKSQECVLSLVRSEALGLITSQKSRNIAGPREVTGEQICEYYPRSDLPREPAARFSALFERRSEWEKTDLLHYIMDLQSPGQTTDALLLKYTRTVHKKGLTTPIYTKR